MIEPNFATFFPVVVPFDAHSLAGFRAWVLSEDFPEHGSISLINGELLIDMSPERLESHNQVKKEITRVIDTLVRKFDSGKVYADGIWITNEHAELSTEPDGVFVRWESLASGRVRIVPNAEGGESSDGFELQGSPDWTLEVVSQTSVRKDTQLLPAAYYKGGVEEYWLVDARGDEIRFAIFVRGGESFEPVPPNAGWLASRVFDCNFQLVRQRDRAGGWLYTLHIRRSQGED